jgi:uncharacterized metal-binding protein
VHRRQILAYKTIKVNNSVRESAHLNYVEEEWWRRHYENLWYSEKYKDETTKINEPHGLDNITIEEVKEALENSKNRKKTGLDGLNMELFKYGGTILQLRLMHLFNMCLKTCAIPKDWLKAKVISLFTKGNINTYKW